MELGITTMRAARRWIQARQDRFRATNYETNSEEENARLLWTGEMFLHEELRNLTPMEAAEAVLGDEFPAAFALADALI